MSGETERQPSGWTVDTALGHVLALMAAKDVRDAQRYEAEQVALRDAQVAQEKAVTAALAAAEKAVAKAEFAAEKRFDAVNEFREQLADQARSFMPRSEYEAFHQALQLRVTQVERRQNDTIAGQMGGDKVWAYIVAIGGALLGIAGIITRFA